MTILPVSRHVAPGGLGARGGIRTHTAGGSSARGESESQLPTALSRRIPALSASEVLRQLEDLASPSPRSSASAARRRREPPCRSTSCGGNGKTGARQATWAWGPRRPSAVTSERRCPPSTRARPREGDDRRYVYEGIRIGGSTSSRSRDFRDQEGAGPSGPRDDAMYSSRGSLEEIP